MFCVQNSVLNAQCVKKLKDGTLMSESLVALLAGFFGGRGVLFICKVCNPCQYTGECLCKQFLLCLLHVVSSCIVFLLTSLSETNYRRSIWTVSIFIRSLGRSVFLRDEYQHQICF